MADNKPLYDLYKGLQANNYEVPDTYESFERTLTEAGKGGADSRHALYETLKKDNYDVPERYENFYSTLFEPVNKTTSRAKGSYGDGQVRKTKPAATAASTPAKAKPKAKPAGTPMTAAERESMLGSADAIVSHSQASLQQAKNRMDYARKNTGLNVPKTRLGAKGSGVRLGQNAKVTAKPSDRWDTETGKPEETFVTESGNEYNDRGAADLEQNAVDEARFKNEQQEAYLLQEKQRIEQEMGQRGSELDDEAAGGSVWRDMPRGGIALNTYNASSGNGRFADSKYKALMAQLDAVNESLATLEEAKKGKASDQWIDDSSNWAAKKGKQALGFLGGAWRGLAHAVGKVSTWDGGTSDMLANGALYNAAVEADKKGVDNISTEDRDLLNLTAYKNAVQAENSKYIGHGYNAGTTTGESLPFMIEMMLSPYSELGSTAANKLMREAVSRYGKEAVKKATRKYLAAKIGARLVGDAAGAAMMAGTTGQGHVTADMLNRMTGDVKFKRDDSGNIVYDGREGAENSALKAYLKAFGAQTIENHSEMVGEYFAPFLGKAASLSRKGMEKIGLGKVNKLIDDIGATNAAKMIGDFEKQTKWNGTIGEYAEEVVGNIENALIVGDNTLDTSENTGVFNLDQNIDTFLGVALMGGFFSAAKTVSYRGPKREALNEMNHAGKVMDEAMSGNFNLREKWGEWRNSLLVGTDEEKKATLREVMDNTQLPMNVRMGVLNFAKAAQKHEGIARAQESKVKNGEQDPVAQAYDESYDKGYEATGTQDMSDVRMSLDMKRAQLAQALGIENADDVDAVVGDPLQFVQSKTGDMSIAQRAAAVDYANAKSAYDGMVQRINDNADDIAERKREGAKMMQHADGMIRPAVMKETDEEGYNKVMYVVDGTVTMLDDGNKVDPIKSDKSVVVYDPTTGKRQMIDPTADTGILSLGTTTSGADYDAMIESDREQYVQDQMDEAQGKVRLAPGMQIVLPTGESATVMAMDGDNVTVGLGDGTQTNVSLEDLQRISDERALADYNQRHGIEPEQGEGQEESPTLSQEGTHGNVQQSGVVDGAPTEFAPDMEVTVRDESGTEKPAMVMGRVRYENGSFVPDENGNIIEYYMDGEVKHDHEGVLRDKVVSHVPAETGESVHDTAESEQNPTEMWLHGKLGAKEYLLQMGYFPEWVNEQTDEKLLEEAAYVAKRNPVAEKEQKQEESVPTRRMTDEQLRQYAQAVFRGAMAGNGLSLPQGIVGQIQQHNKQILDAENARKEAEANRKPTPLEFIPVDKETGEPMFEHADSETALAALEELTGGSEARTEAIVSAQVAQANKALEALKNQRPTRKAPALSGSPMAMAQAQQDADTQYNAAMEQYNAQVAAATKKAQAWGDIASTMNGKRRAEREREAERKKAEARRRFVGSLAANKPDYSKAVFGSRSNGLDLPHDVLERIQQHNQRMVDEAHRRKSTVLDHIPVDPETGSPVLDEVDSRTALAALDNEESAEAIVGAQAQQANKALEALKKAMPMLDNGEEDWHAVTPERAHQYIYNEAGFSLSEGNQFVAANVDAAQKTLDKAMAAPMPQVGTSIQKYNQAKAKRQEKIDEAQKALDYWNGVRDIQNGIQQEEDDRRAVADAERHEETKTQADNDAHMKAEGAQQDGADATSGGGNGEKSAENNAVAPYTILPATYTNKKGKTTEMHLVKFDHELTKEQKSAGKELAKESRGWWDAKQGGFMMRSEEAAKKLAEALGSEEAVQDAQPMSAQDMEAANDKGAKGTTGKKAKTAKKPKAANRVEVADQTEEQPKAEHQQEEAKEEPKQETKAKSKWVDDEDAERFEELRKRLRMKLRGQLNMGIDPEAFSIGVEMSFMMLKHGARKFSEYAKNMIEALGEDVRPYLKSFYNGARDLPEMEDFEKELTPYEEVRAFDVKNFDKEGAKDLVATAEHIAKEHAVEQEAEEATNKLKSQRNEQRKEADEQRAADTTALAREGETTASEAESQLASEGVEQGADEIAEGIDDALDKVNDQLALLGYYEADHVKKDYNEATGYMRNAEKKAVKDAANLASNLIDDLGLDREEATHGAPGKNGKRKTKPLAVANIAPAGGDITMHLPLAEGRELYMNISLFPSAGKDVAGYEGDNLEVDLVMWRVENPNAKGDDRYGRNNYAPEDVTYKQLLELVQRDVYKYIPQRADVADGEYKVGDKVEYTHDGGRTWTDGIVAQPNDMDGIRIDTGHAPIMWVNATKDQLRHKATPRTQAKTNVDEAVKKAKADMAAKLEQVKAQLDEKILTDQIAQRDKFIDELDTRVGDGERIGTFAGMKNVDLPATLVKCIGERDALEEALENLHTEQKRQPSTEDIADNPQSWVGKTFTYNGMQLVCNGVDKGYASFDNKTTYIGMGFDVSQVQGWLKSGKFKVVGEKTAEPKRNEPQAKSISDADIVKRITEHPLFKELVNNNPDPDGARAVLDGEILNKVRLALRKDGYINAYKRLVTDPSFASKILDNAFAHREMAGEDYVQKAERIANEEQTKQDVKATSTLAERPKQTAKPSKSKKKVKPEQKVGDLFAGGLPDKEEENNGLERNHDAVRTGGLQADGGGQQQGLREGEGSRGQGTPQEGGRPDTGRGRQGNGQDGPVPAGLHGLGERKNVRNNHSERGVDHAPKSVNARIDANIKAIELAKQLLESGETATPEQMSVLRQFSGWGGLGAALSTSTTDWKMRERNRRIQDLLGKEAYDEAVMSANSAYYTPAYVVDTLWDVARQLGFKGGHILEGSAGIGNILGQMPMDMSDRSDIHAIEIDGTSGGILSLLYPDAKVDIKGFEQTRIPNGSVDLAITNVPFVTGLRVNDTTGDGDLSKKFHNIHDFCIAKNVRKLRDGGLGIFISSNGTLDNSKALRDWVVNEGGSDFVGAFRMNNQTFGGTAVTSDIIIIRKRVNGQKSANAIDVSNISAERTAEYQEPGGRKKKQLSMDYNKYFIEHPDHMAGEMRFAFEGGETFRPTSKGLYPVSGKDQGKMLQEFVQTLKAEEAGERASETEVTMPNVYEELGKDVKEGSMVVDGNGNICIAQYGKAVPVMSEPSKTDKAKGGVTEEDLRKRFQDKKIKGHTKAECFKDYTAIKTALADVMKYQTENEGDAGLKPLIDKLNKAYDDFVAKYGHFNKNNQLAWLRKDVDYPNVVSLEDYQEMGDGKGGVTKTYDKADVMKHRVVEKENEPHPENVKDGVVVSMFRSGRIDVPYIAEQLGMSEADVKREIIESGLGFEDPTTKQMEVSYQYLSGNVREKLRQAEANNENGEYAGNIKALQDVVPMDIPAHLIDFTLGSSWLSPKLYDEYVKDRTDIDVKFTAVGGSWFMDEPYYVSKEKNRAMGVVSETLNRTVYGHELIEAAIQNRTIIVSKTTKHYDGTSETVTDREATAACAAKIDEIRQDFKDWMRQKMQSDPEMSAKMETEYNDRFNNYVPMKIPDEFVPKYFGGATHKFRMREHQGKAIVRGTMQPVMLAHEVGTGKTFTLISTAMEMRRLGTARKPMVVVQNATVGQFVASAKELYPNAKILTLEDGDRDVEGRKNFYAKIKYNDWDMIVIPQSTFERIPDSDERQMAFIQSKIDEKIMVLEKMKEADAGNSNPVTRQAEREIESLRAEMAEMAENVAKKRSANDEKKRAVAKQNAAVRAQEMLDRKVDDVENFDDMGIDALLVDEAHEYKHLGFSTAMQRGVKGVDPSYSKKAQGVYLKTQAVLEKNNGRNVVFATGTPISNTAAEIWTFMRYLMPADTMKEYGIYYFDDFVRNFGNLQQMPEFNVSGKFKEVNRFAGYVNLPELVRIWSGVADTVLTKDQKELVDKIPAMEGGKAQDIYLPQTRALRSVMKFVRKQLKEFEQMTGKEKRENSHIPLTMYGIAQGAAVDARLVVSDAEDDPNSKTNEAVRQTLRSLKETDGYNGTVAIFADHYQNKQSGFNLYEDIKKKLIEQGVPEKEIAVMKSGMTIKKKLDIFDKVNHGEVRVIMGSTATLGTGVNIQERLHTLIHLDAPNRPMDYTQRNGRILRQGNLHKQWDKPVRVLRFGVEDSLDVTAYQRLKTKGAIADSIMEGDKLMKDSMNNRVLEEEDDVFGDTVAQLSGSEYALLKNNAEKNVRKYESRRRQWEADQTYIHNAKPKLEGQIKAAEQRAEEAKAHLQAVKKAFPDGKAGEITVGKKKFGTVESMADLIKEHNKKINDDAKAMKENPADDKHKHTLTLSMGGFDFVVNTELSRDVTRSGAGLFTEVHRVMTYSCPELGLEDVPVKQALIRNAIEDITENVITGNDFAERQDIAERSAKHGKSELEQLKSREGKPFEYSKELEEAERQLEEYTEAMKAELEEKEKKYAEMDKTVEAATDVVIDDEEEEDGDGDSASYRIVDDPALLNELEDGEWVEVYRVMQVIDDELYPPMAAVREGDLVTPIRLGLVEQAEEHPELITFDENGKPQFLLNKGQGKGSLKAAYNPYWHTSLTALNDQFSSAYIRPNLVVVRTLVPKSELTSGYRAQYAKDAVGEMSWHSGTVSGRLAELGKPRRVILSRYDKPMEIVPHAEVAKMIAEQLEGTDIAIPYNVVWPQLRDELEKLGVEISDEASGTVGEDTSYGKAEYVTDKMIADMNEKAKRGMPRTPEAKRTEAERLGQKFNTRLNIIEDTNAIVHTDPKIQARRRKAKGWYDTRTGEVTIVLPNNMNVEDVAETVFHETVGHKGLRELIGEKGYSDFLREVYAHAKADVRRRIAKLAAKHNWDFDKATDEYLSKLAEKGFEDFDREERSMWQWLKEKVMKAIDKFLKTLKLPKWVKLGDNELRYMLWRSKERLERGKEDLVDRARDIVKREELGLSEGDLYREDGETDDIWKDGSMGLQERITAAATRLANNHRDNKTLRNDAMRAIGGNLTDLRKAMSLQRKFDVTTVKRVADLARVLMNGGYLNHLSQQEVKRLLAAVKNSTGHNDIEGDVQKVMDIMVDNQLKNAEATLHALESIKGTKVDARGVQVQGQLDADGAHVMAVFKKTRGWERSDIEDAMADAQQRMGRADVTVADEAALDYAGMQLALDYVENITGSKTEEADLRKEMKQAHDDADEDDRKTDSYRQYVDMMREAIRQNRIDRAQAYYDLVARMSGGLRESMANANAFKDAEKARIRDIQHNANSDMEGRPSDEHYRPKAMDKFVNNSFVQYMFAPLGTFDQMLRLFGNKSANGEGYLYNRFMRGWVDARQKEIKGVRSKFAVLDAKAAELFGGKVKTWSDLIRKVGSLPKATVSFWNGGEMQDQELSQGNLMYIYMVNKMLDGRMKLRKMGISDDDVDAIEEALDPRLVELADWLQNEFLVDTRNEYNETHKRMFGTSMAAIENYFPLKILANARADKAEDLDNPEKADGISTSTGSIIKRRRNALALDITGADALHVILDHVAQMEHWNAFAELNRDLNTLRTYKRFRNQVQNMTTIYGSGTELWKKFNTLCQMMAGTYRPPRAKLDEAAVNFAKGVTAAKVSFRVFTALKQFLSMPAYIPEARADYLLADIVNPVGAWKWCMANLPIFEERWKGRMAGDPRLLKSDMDWKMWRSRVMELAGRWGMAPNAFVDAVTVAIGAHSMYKTRLAQYLRDGYDEETAEHRANQDAEILYNQTQQSSEGPFTSTMQVDRSWLSVLFTVFRNSSMAYTRQLHDAVRNLRRNLAPGQRAKSIEFMKKQMERDGIDEATAAASAGRKFRRQMTKDALRVATFGCIMQLAWNLGAYLPYLLFGDDDDTKDEFWKDVWTHTAFGWLEGFTGGDVLSQAGGMLLSGEGNPTNVSKDMPLTSDLMSVLQKFGNGKKAEAITDIVNIVAQSGIGVNPQSITDAVIGIMDACGDDPELAHEAAICVSRILQVPQSQIDKMYFDDVDLSGDEASKYTPAQLAERYARYKVKRGRLYAPWSWNDEEQKGKSADKANTLIKERTEKMGDGKVNESYLRYEEVYKGVDKQVQAARKAAGTDYVKAAEIMATLQKDPQTFATYQTFKQTDSMLDKIAKLYMEAKTPEEASLCLRTMVDFKAKMVDALDNVGTDKAGQTMQRLGAVMQDFSQKYAAMQPNR